MSLIKKEPIEKVQKLKTTNFNNVIELGKDFIALKKSAKDNKLKFKDEVNNSELDISIRTVERFMKIAKNDLLVANVEKLPFSISLIYVLATVKKDTLEKAFNDNLIFPKMNIDDCNKIAEKTVKAMMPIITTFSINTCDDVEKLYQTMKRADEIKVKALERINELKTTKMVLKLF